MQNMLLRGRGGGGAGWGSLLKENLEMNKFMVSDETVTDKVLKLQLLLEILYLEIVAL